VTEPVGVLPVDKPAGPTSHDVVAIARRALRTRRIGHTGTLDPFASGLLLLCLGPATRLAEYLTPLPKTYRATLRLGEATDTDDLSGEVIRASEGWRDVSESQLRDALAAQVGELRQLPPLFSAKKVDGERMYAAARRGEVVERTPSTVTVHRIELLDVALPDATFEVECGSGTYIRAIARDVGEALGVGGHLRALRRTRSGRFDVGGALSLDALAEPDAVRATLVDPLAALGHLPRVDLDSEGVRAVAHGRAVPLPEPLPAGSTVALASSDGALVAVGEVIDQTVHPRKVFA
jgi:tRNA pseudouridine55 synthase